MHRNVVTLTLRSLAVVFIAASLTACMKTTFYTDGNPIDDSQVATREDISHYFIEGLGQRSDVNAAEICGGAENVAKVQTQRTFVNYLVSVITFGFYTPQQYRVYCSANR